MRKPREGAELEWKRTPVGGACSQFRLGVRLGEKRKGDWCLSVSRIVGVSTAHTEEKGERRVQVRIRMIKSVAVAKQKQN